MCKQMFCLALESNFKVLCKKSSNTSLAKSFGQQQIICQQKKEKQPVPISNV